MRPTSSFVLVASSVTLSFTLACSGTTPATATATPTPTTTTATATATSPTTQAPAATAATKPVVAADIEIPQGSGDYREVLALARNHQNGNLSWEELERALIARKLPPHSLGDGYLMIPVPMPPPGIPFDPKMMPSDWQGTWGEVAMAFWLGALTQEQYDRLHASAHPACKKV